ncbi:protease inhibitor I9 family protein, partial [Micromonospora sp. CPCC 205371]|nr:protease inhibitor I9 family protein [Micromonospora sp. CPCC 205371]
MARITRTTRFAVIAGAAILVAAAGPAATAVAAPAGGTILAAPGADVVPGSYVVVLKDGSTAVPAQAKALAGKHRATVRKTFSHALRGFSATMSEAQAKALAGDPAVKFVQPNVIHRVSATQTNPPSYGLDRIDQRNRPVNAAYTYNTTASNVHAYIVDTGIRTSHNDFGGRATSGFDAIDGGGAADWHGHGPHVAGTVAGGADGGGEGVA